MTLSPQATTPPVPPVPPVPPASQPTIHLEAVNARLADATPEQIIRYAHERLGEGLVMTSSFGAQSAIMLHLVTRIIPDIPVIFIDTGYLFPETYQFAELLTKQLGLNLKVYQSPISPARMEALHGKLWEDEKSNGYDDMRKVEPMQRAIRELGVTGWLAGLRKNQTKHRAGLETFDLQNGIYKIHPILRWSTKDVHDYLKKHGLEYHPLYYKGYASIGDIHNTFPIGSEEHERAGRFAGVKEECGLHLPATPEENKSRDGSGL
jgi:phosphoadenosine phosphosulfate reductase